MIHQSFAALTALLSVLAESGCDPLGRPSLDPSFGIRVTDGEVRIWTGSPCSGTTGVDLTFDMSQDSEATLQLRTPATAPKQAGPPGVTVEYITVGGCLVGYLKRPRRSPQVLCATLHRHILVPGHRLAHPSSGRGGQRQNIPEPVYFRFDHRLMLR